MLGNWGHYGTVMAPPGYVADRTTLVINTDLFDGAIGKVAL